MALTPEQQARLNAARAKYGLSPTTQRLPVGTLPTMAKETRYGNLVGPKLGDLGAVSRGLDPMGLTRGNFGNLRGNINDVARQTVDPAGVFGNDPKKVKGKIDPTTGTVTVGNYGKHNEALSNAYTNYLRTGNKGQLTGGNGAFKPLKKEIQRMQASGWTPPAPQTAAPPTTPGRIPGYADGGKIINRKPNGKGC